MRPLSSVIPAAGPCDPVAMHGVLARTARTFMNSASAGYGVPTSTLLQEGIVSSASGATTSLLELRGAARVHP